MPSIQKLQTLSSIISTPYVTAEFGGYQFGLRNSIYKNRTTFARDIQCVTGLTINKKASGQVNTYSLSLAYTVVPGADPNFVDYIIARATDRQLLLSYGDLGQPEYSYVKEQAIISNVSPDVNFSSNSIQYTIAATSSVALSYVVKRSYQGRSAKPSDVIKEMLWSRPDEGLLELFGGMRDKATVEENGWIASNDRAVYIEAQKDIAPLDYIRYLVSKMSAPDGSFYAMLIHDEPDNADGPYFMVVNSTLYQGQGNTYQVSIDVGYPSDTPVYDFKVTQNTSLALITPYLAKFDKPRIVNINSMGETITESTPSLAIRNGTADSSLKQWWQNMTTYPVKATLTTRGLIKPSILCDYLDINVLFFGQPYTYSGKYMVTAQEDSISPSGYTTKLSLVRVESN